MAITTKTAKVKLPVAWDAKKNNGEGGVVSEPVEHSTQQIGTLSDLLEVLRDSDNPKQDVEKDALAFINSALWNRSVQNEYQNRSAKLRPTDMSVEQRIERFVSMASRYGFMTESEARAIAQAKADAGELN